MNQPLPPKPKKISPALLPLAKVVDPIDAELMGLKPPLIEPPLQDKREPPLQSGGEPTLQGEPPLSVQGEPPLTWDPAKVAEAGRERVRHKVPEDLSYVVPPCNGRRLPSMPVHGRRTRACITLDRDVYLATAQRALEYRLSVSACINYALAQWLGKGPATLV